MAISTKKTHARGFTLIEVLLVVCILAVLLALALPSLSALQRSLRMRELDDTARQIFLSVQNELTAMKATGALDDLNHELTQHYSQQNLGTLNEPPADCGDGDTSWKKLYYLSSSDAAMTDYLVRSNSVLRNFLSDGSFLVELNPESGDVYGVFYAKRSAIGYDEIVDLNLLGRTQGFREPVQLGYYGGFGDTSGNPNLPTSFSPVLTVVNKQDLYLTVSCDDLRPFVRSQRLLTLQITITDEDYVEGGTAHRWQKNYYGGTDFQLSATGQFSTHILLDSLRPGSGFASQTGGALTPGDNLIVSASLTYSTADIAITGSASANTNGLFADKKTAPDGAVTLEVGYLRQLNNLRGSLYPGDPARVVQIHQTRTIDFDAKTWLETDLLPGAAKTNPLADSGFPPIENTALFLPTRSTVYDGGGNTLCNFVFRGADNRPTGLFGAVTNGVFRQVRLVDCSAQSNGSAGLLAGLLAGGTITDCHAHLSTRDEFGRSWPDMDARVLRYAVSGAQGVGALVGTATGTVNIEGSFAAVNVSGRSAVGGLAGSWDTGSIANCYGSGDVTATAGQSGGLIGQITSAAVSGCYSTGNVTAPQYAGGLVGRTVGGAASSFSNCRSYGLVRRSNGTVDAATSGPFLGPQSKPARLTECRYLQQGNYNSGYPATASGIATGFLLLKSQTPNSAQVSHPYSAELTDAFFPFPLTRNASGAALDHWGNWPEELKLQTSLVYYEKYKNADGSFTYGYYAKTSLTGSGGTGDATGWLVDTLEDRICVEDGYAILTKFKLDRMTYRYNDDLNPSAPTVELTTVDSVAQAGPGKAALITEGASLVFRKDSLTYTITNARVYQLPFDLQITARAGAPRFFDKVTMTGYVGTQARFNDFVFYYCPDFAKNAVNPDPGSSSAPVPEDPRGEASPIYVRSPRQLSGLSRATYYWNEAQTASGLAFYFKQETDLDFGQYAKNYCGVTYDLMDTSEGNPYRNRPIGRPASGYQGSQFRNVYDGCGKQIIDYCCVTYPKDDYQFVGLFGEVRLATLKNINMVASRPGDANTRSSAYVYANYNSGRLCNGVGALVGLIYEDQIEIDTPATVARVLNCSVTGYDVKNVTPNISNNTNSAVGGLAGYNFGLIQNSSAVNKLVASESNGTGTRYLGGLAGSLNGRGTIERSYAAAALRVSNHPLSRASLGGLCGGFNSIYGYQAAAQKITNSYSYCTWDTANLPVGTAYAVAPLAAKFTLSNCSYLTDTVGAGVSLQDTDVAGKITPRDFGQLSALALGRQATAANSHPYLPALHNRAYPFPAALTVPNTGVYCHFGDWPFVHTALQSAHLTYYEQYGDGTWGYCYLDGRGDKTTAADSLDRSNGKTILRAGYGLLHLEGMPLPALDGVPLTDSELEPAPATAVLSISGGVYRLRPFTQARAQTLAPDRSYDRAVTLGYSILENGAAIGDKTDTLYLNVRCGAALSAGTLPANESQPLEIRTADQLQRMTGTQACYFKQTHSILASPATGMLVNTGYSFDGGYRSGGAVNSTYASAVGGNGNYIFGLTKPLFQENRGTLKNVALLGVNLTSSDSTGTAALTLENIGTIQACFAKGSVTATATAAGLVLNNGGTLAGGGRIDGAYFSGSVTSIGGRAAGLVGQNAGSISNVYTAGAVSAPMGTASGLVWSNTGSIVRCYSIADIRGGTAYGICPKRSGAVSEGHWLQSDAFNTALDPSGAGASIKSSDLKKKDMGGAWTADNAAHSYPDKNTGDFPYPRLILLDHYGDWPTIQDAVTRTGRIGAATERSELNWATWESVYYVKGGYISITDPIWQTLTTDATTRSGWDPIVLLDAAEAPDNWTATFGGDRYTLEAYNRPFENLPTGMKAYVLNGAGLKNNTDLVLTDLLTGNSYTFKYKNSNFTYIK